MSDTEARAGDDATPDDHQEGQAASDEDDATEEAPDDEPETPEGPQPTWWHRSHPTFAGLVGFFTGVAYVIIVPGGYAALLGLLVSDSTAQQLFPLVLVALLVPLAMLVFRKTRRFALFMFLGIVSTAVVIVATSALVIWVMVKVDG